MGDNQLKPLGDEQVEAVTGGYIYFAGGDDFYKRWEVIDGNGDVVARFGFFRRGSRLRGINRSELLRDYLGTAAEAEKDRVNLVISWTSSPSSTPGKKWTAIDCGPLRFFPFTPSN